MPTNHPVPPLLPLEVSGIRLTQERLDDVKRSEWTELALAVTDLVVPIAGREGGYTCESHEYHGNGVYLRTEQVGPIRFLGHTILFDIDLVSETPALLQIKCAIAPCWPGMDDNIGQYISTIARVQTMMLGMLRVNFQTASGQEVDITEFKFPASGDPEICGRWPGQYFGAFRAAADMDLVEETDDLQPRQVLKSLRRI